MRRILLAGLVALCAVALPPLPGYADERASGYVKYYEIPAGQRPGLDDVAKLLLADPDRAGELYDLNRDRRQPDGAALTGTGAALHPGWLLVLPWDAEGDAVRYGLLPGAEAAPGWAVSQLGLDRANLTSTGGGVLVAVVDSGVDAGVAELSGRVEPGADITTGTELASTDTVGSGTALAGLIAADGTRVPGSPAGVAPHATILPIRVATTTRPATAATVATGIEVAVSAGARVIVLGAYAPATDDTVRAAIASAVAHGVPVVLPAAGPQLAGQPGILRVAAFGPDLGVDAAAADVAAPGLGVTTLRPAGKGTATADGAQYAAAYVAGTAALVRARFPGLDAVAVADRITATATRHSGGGPGRVSPVAALAPLPSTPDPATGPWRTAVLGVLAATGLACAFLLFHRSRRKASS